MENRAIRTLLVDDNLDFLEATAELLSSCLGLDVAREIKQLPNAPKVVILTLHDGDEYRGAAREAGADGFLTKSELGHRLLPLGQGLFDPAAAA